MFTKRNAVILVGKRETPVRGQMRNRRAAVEWRIFMEEKETVREPYRMEGYGKQYRDVLYDKQYDLRESINFICPVESKSV